MGKFEGATILICYALAAISGGLGGCAVTAHSFITGGEGSKAKMRLSWLLAYSIIGAVFGLLTVIYGIAFIQFESYGDIMGPSLIAGIIGATSLSAMNLTARFVLKQFGVEVIVTVRRDSDAKKDNTNGI